MADHGEFLKDVDDYKKLLDSEFYSLSKCYAAVEPMMITLLIKQLPGFLI
jgi:hypothetical protein